MDVGYSISWPASSLVARRLRNVLRHIAGDAIGTSMHISTFIFALIFSLPSFAVLESKLGDNPCVGALTQEAMSSDMRLAIAGERSTDEVAQLLVNNLRDPEEWIIVDFVQDQSHLAKAPPIPGFALTFIARQAFNKKIRGRIVDQRATSDFPKLTKMYFLKQPEEFKGITATLTTHTFVKMKSKDLPIIVDWFVETMYHPALGNKVFKISLVM